MKHHVLSAAVSFLLLHFVSVANAANTVSNEDISIDPNTVTPQTRMKWCDDQTASCATLCGDEGIGINSCDHNTLDYACTCSDGSAPGLQYYTKTMPTYICEESYKVCDGAADGDADAEEDCEKHIKSQCGTLDQSTLAQEKDSDSESTGGSTGTAAAKTSSPSGSTTTGSAAISTSSTTGTPDLTSESKDSDSSKIARAAGGVVAVSLAFAGVAYVFYRRGKNHTKKRANKMGGAEEREPDGPFEKLDSGDGWSSYELDTTQHVPGEMPAPAFKRPVAELESPKVFIAELDDTSVSLTGSKTIDEREDTKYRM